jgi:hypothetical protein
MEEEGGAGAGEPLKEEGAGRRRRRRRCGLSHISQLVYPLVPWGTNLLATLTSSNIFGFRGRKGHTNPEDETSKTQHRRWA